MSFIFSKTVILTNIHYRLITVNIQKVLSLLLIGEPRDLDEIKNLVAYWFFSALTRNGRVGD